MVRLFRNLNLSTRTIFLFFLPLGVLNSTGQILPPKLPRESRALQFLTREVPSWRTQNGCFSCHNNGDGARVLFLASRLNYPVQKEPLQETISWLERPGQWDENKGNPGFSDKRLARVQFAASLLEAHRAGVIGDESLLQAARSLLEHQAPNGAWPIDIGEQVGSPVTYGTPLATAMAILVLEAANNTAFADPLNRAQRWLADTDPHSIPDAAAVLLIFGNSIPGQQTPGNREGALKLIEDSQKSDGGWGPYRFSPSEVFDTALALIALSKLSLLSEEQLISVQKGRAYLENSQLDSGGWIETTRPSGAESYAQHVSTSAWAAQALIETVGIAAR